MAFERELGLAVAAGAVAAYPPARDVAKKGASIVVDTAGRAGGVVVGAGKGAYEGARSGLSAPPRRGAAQSSRSTPGTRPSSSRRGTSRSRSSRSSSTRSRRSSSSSKSGS